MRAITSTERISAWQCIGCGRIEGAQPCVGICQDRRTEFVYASDHGEVLVQLTRERHRANMPASLVRQIATTTPHQDAWAGAPGPVDPAHHLPGAYRSHRSLCLDPANRAGIAFPGQISMTYVVTESCILRKYTDVASISQLFETHVRFEERELFPLTEAILPAKKLAAVAAVAVAKPRQHKLTNTGA